MHGPAGDNPVARWRQPCRLVPDMMAARCRTGAWMPRQLCELPATAAGRTGPRRAAQCTACDRVSIEASRQGFGSLVSGPNPKCRRRPRGRRGSAGSRSRSPVGRSGCLATRQGRRAGRSAAPRKWAPATARPRRALCSGVARHQARRNGVRPLCSEETPPRPWQPCPTTAGSVSRAETRRAAPSVKALLIAECRKALRRLSSVRGPRHRARSTA